MNTEKPRRLGPLRLDSSKQGESIETPEVSEPRKPEPETFRALEDAKTPRSTVAASTRTRNWPVITGVVLFVGVGFGVVLAILVTRSGAETSPVAAAAVLTRTTSPSLKQSSTETWAAWLHSPTCEAPCCGGTACLIAPTNQGKRGCKLGESACSKCSSGITCIPGDCGSALVPGETWGFHLSAVAERGSGSGVLDPCKTKRDLWLCVRSKDRPNGVCLSQLDACKNQARSALGAPITSDDLVSGGFDLDVRLGGPDGTVLASKTAAKYTGGVDRRTLCNGLIVNYPESSPIAYVTFYLDVPEEG